MSRRALITGITGQDGALLADLLLGRGYEVAGLVRSNGPVDRSRLERLGSAGRVSLRAVDLCDPAASFPFLRS